MSRIGHLKRGLVVLVCLLLGLLPAFAHATETLRVRVQRPLEDDALIDEAVNRVIGELAAVGFDVEVLRRRTRPADLDVPGPLDPGTEGALVFARDGDTVLVAAWVANGEQAFVQRFVVTEPRTSAEVIAVSAVEALRGVLIAPGRAANPSPAGPAKGEANPVPPTEVERPSAPEPTPIDPLTLPPSNIHLRAQAFVAPTAGLDGDLLPTLGGAANVLVGVDGFALGAGVQRLFYVAAVRDDAGSASIERQHIAGIVHGGLDLGPRWEAFAELQAGVVDYTVKPEASVGFVATEQTHSDLALGAGLGVAHWAFDYLGWFARAEALVLPKPIRVLMEDRAVATLGSPATTLSVGLAARLK